MAGAEQLKKQVGRLWRNTVQQLEGVRRTVEGSGRKARKQIEHELDRLRMERDRLVIRLGEQTLQWINQSPVPVPEVLRTTVTKLNEVVASLKTAEAKPAPETKAYHAPRYAQDKAHPEKKTPAAKKKKVAGSAPKKKAAPKAKAAKPAKSKPANKGPVARKTID